MTFGTIKQHINYLNLKKRADLALACICVCLVWLPQGRAILVKHLYGG